MLSSYIYIVLFSFISCLVKRGADVNVEDKDRCRPDDVRLLSNSAEDCKEIIQLHREQRCQYLSDMVTNVSYRCTLNSVCDKLWL